MFTVYLADRDAAHRKDLAHALRRRGLRAVEFTSGAQLYSSVLVDSPDLVVLDVDLDEMDGFQFFSRLLRRREDRPLPLVFLSEYVNAHVVEVCLKRGARAYLRKGDPADRLATTVSDLLAAGDGANPNATAAGPDDAGAARATSASHDDSRAARAAAVRPEGSRAARAAAVRPEGSRAARDTEEPQAVGQGRAARARPGPALEEVHALKRRRWKQWVTLAACALVAALGFAIGAALAARAEEIPSPTLHERAPISGQGSSAHAVRGSDGPLAPAEILASLGLTLPAGAVHDVAGSDVRPLSERGERSGARTPRVLTFRLGQPLDEVLEIYAREGVTFDRRVVRMDGRFQGVERTIARGRLTLENGVEATLTVSHPGIDLAARSLVPETSLRIDIRE